MVFKLRKGALILVFIFLFSMILPGCIQSSAADWMKAKELNKFKDGAIFMHVGSPLILSGEDVSFLDPTDFDVAVAIHKDRTLVPLRAVSEYLGGMVSYDKDKAEAAVSYGDSEFVFPIGKSEVFIKKAGKSETIKMDTAAMIIKGRTMVPVRILAEKLFNKSVDYRDEIVVITDDKVFLGGEASLVKAVKSKIGMATRAKSENQLMAMLKANDSGYGKGFRGTLDIATGLESAAPESVDTGNMKGAGQNENLDKSKDSSASEEYSTTNTQVEGIDEADIIKTDGKYLYYAGNNAVRIIKADGAKLSEVSIIKFSRDKYVQEIYLDKDRLIVMGNRNQADFEEKIMPADKGVEFNRYKQFAFVDIYDVSDQSEPVFIKGHEMEGYYQSSRKSGDHVYLISSTGWYGGIIRPLMKESQDGGEAVPVDLSDIMVMPEPVMPGYVILSALNIKDQSRTEVEAITAFGASIYMNDSSLYLAAEDFEGFTNITKFRIDGMNIGYAGSGKVKGSILNQFSMDEYEGNLRVASSVWDEGNNMSVLDGSLNEIGSVKGLAKGETIYSVRFMGDKGYVVTFRTMDPLFVFDLSDPADPKVTGELKIPGFSNYLHPVGEDLILGIGMETKELFERDAAGRENPVGFRQGGLKVSLFDVSDMGKPREIDNYVIGENGTYSEALYNHKAVMVDSKSEQIAFDAYVVKDKDWKNSEQGALIINYGDRKIKEKGFLNSKRQESYDEFTPYGRRLVYIGEFLYYIQDGIIDAYDYDSLEKLGSLAL